ncbi:hypothetical protein Cni_G14368 [Canna indica]|uniref:Uncharacterized protein n=1 Tax=Canna indica TaxID=4628 RepID=A0AAQ3QCB2_9LILI|nr:hypothetical protein Cni_G14368 [Canna indica]
MEIIEVFRTGVVIHVTSIKNGGLATLRLDSLSMNLHCREAEPPALGISLDDIQLKQNQTPMHWKGLQSKEQSEIIPISPGSASRNRQLTFHLSAPAARHQCKHIRLLIHCTMHEVLWCQVLDNKNNVKPQQIFLI